MNEIRSGKAIIIIIVFKKWTKRNGTWTEPEGYIKEREWYTSLGHVISLWNNFK